MKLFWLLKSSVNNLRENRNTMSSDSALKLHRQNAVKISEHLPKVLASSLLVY